MLKETKEIIGTIAAPTVKNRIDAVEVTYCIGSRWWGNGIVPEALKAVMRYMFEEVQANRIEAGFDSNNPNSGRVMEKVGMQKVSNGIFMSFRAAVLRQTKHRKRLLYGSFGKSAVLMVR